MEVPLTKELSAIAILIIRKLELLLQAKKPAVTKAIAVLRHVLVYPICGERAGRAY